MHVDKAEIVAILRARGLNERANWVDQTLTDAVDTHTNASLLQTLGIDPADMTAVEVPHQRA
jgi:hypothetical protein